MHGKRSGTSDSSKRGYSKGTQELVESMFVCFEFLERVVWC